MPNSFLIMFMNSFQLILISSISRLVFFTLVKFNARVVLRYRSLSWLSGPSDIALIHPGPFSVSLITVGTTSIISLDKIKF